MLLAFDDFVRGQAALTAPTEKEFVKFVSHQEKYSQKCKTLQQELSKLKAENETKEIKLKHVRNSFNEEMKKRMEAEELARQYEQQFEMIRDLLCANDRMSMLNEEEKRSLFNFGGDKSMLESSNIQLSEISVDPLDEDKDISILRNGRRWKRRRTRSTDNKLDDDPPAKRSSLNEDDEDVVPEKMSPERPVPPSRTLSKPPISRSKKNKPSEKEMMKKSLSETNFLEVTREIAMEEAEQEQDKEQPLSAPTTPSAPPMPEGLYPILKNLENMSPPPINNQVVVKSPGGGSTHTNGCNLRTRVHSFVVKKVIRPETCQVCNKRIGFGRSAHKCKECRGVCHPGCKDKLPVPCVPVANTPRKGRNDGDLEVYCPTTSPRIPPLIVHCIREVEKRGLSEVGIYRVPGSDVKVKELKDKLLRGKGHPNLGKVEDIHVICSALKDFLRSLKEPLLTYQLHGAFSLAADMSNEEEALAQILQAIAQLPTANKDTLAFLVLHLKKVASHHQGNMMSGESLAKVFGPTIVGHASPDPEPATIWHDTQRQPKIVQRIMAISNEYWEEYVNPSDQFALIASPDVLSVKSPGGSSVGSPATPEYRPVPESPFLGPINSPVRQPSERNPNHAPNTVNRKRHGPFFAPLD